MTPGINHGLKRILRLLGRPGIKRDWRTKSPGNSFTKSFCDASFMVIKRSPKGMDTEGIARFTFSLNQKRSLIQSARGG
uniref:Uncharacterized protein L09WR n=1 Tax=African swine fever virus TaxID=10497 RepID=Q8V9S4_ASF|nr:putative protein [African swine fever virus]